MDYLMKLFIAPSRNIGEIKEYYNFLLCFTSFF